MTTKSTLFHSVLFIVLFIALTFADKWLPKPQQDIVQVLTAVSDEESLEEELERGFQSQQVNIPTAIVDELLAFTKKRKNIESHQWFKTASMEERLAITEAISRELYNARDFRLLNELNERLDAKYLTTDSVLFHYASSRSKVGDVDSAIEVYKQLVGLYPNHQSAMLNLGLLLRKQDKHTESNEILHQAERVSSGRKLAKARALLASNYRALGQLEVARKFYISSIEYRPNHSSTWSKLANLEAQMALPEKVVLKTYERAVALAPSSVNVLTRAAEYALRIGEFESALNWFQQAELLAPKNDKVRVGLAWTQSELGNWVAASHHWGWLANHASRKKLRLIGEHLYLTLNEQSVEQLQPLPNSLEGHYSQLFITQLANETPDVDGQVTALLESDKWRVRTEIRLASKGTDAVLSLEQSH